jgi:ribose transport system permease protein
MAPAGPAVDGRLRSRLRSLPASREAGALGALVVLCVLLAVMSPRTSDGNAFLSLRNAANILNQVCVTAILAAGSSLVIFGGGIDLSVGSVLALGAAMAAGAMRAGYPVPVAAAAALASGALLGSVNGILVSALRMPPFIATLGMMGIARGLTYVYLGGAPIFGFPESFRSLAEGRMLGIPAPVVVMAGVFAACHVLLTRTAFGRSVYAMGGNEEAARLAGIPVARRKTAVYSLCGMAAGLAGLVLAARLDSAEPQAADGYELDAIAAVVMGGASLSGGEGTVGGSLIGALIMGVVRNGLNLLNVSAYWQKVAIGSIILVAVLVDVARRRNRE